MRRPPRRTLALGAAALLAGAIGFLVTQARQRGHAEDLMLLEFASDLFDVAMVFAVALMAAIVGRFNLSDLRVAENFNWVKNPGTPQMEIVTKRGKRVGAAYQL